MGKMYESHDNVRSQLHRACNKALNQNLVPGETIQVIILGLWDSAIIGTDRRAFVFKNGMMAGAMSGARFASWEYNQINGIQIEEANGGPDGAGFVSIQIPGACVAKGSYWDTSKYGPAESPNAICINKAMEDHAQRGVAVLRQLIAAANKPSVASAPTDAPDLLRKLATLRDEGVLTKAEFETAKAKLLSPAH